MAPITVTGKDQRTAWRTNSMPSSEKLRDGAWSIPVVFPGNPMRYTLSYLLRSGDDAILVDPGWDSDAGENQLRSGCAQAGIALEDLTGIVATHYHSDHLGMAGRIRRISGAWVAMGEHEFVDVQTWDSTARYQAEQNRQYILWGTPDDVLADVGMNDTRVSQLTQLATPDVRLRDGQRLPVAGLDIEVMLTPGHSPGHICLIDWSHELIFSGDHVLPRISPHISLDLSGLEDPLQAYYNSLERIGFEDDMEVCPAHEYRFIGMRRRVEQLVEHNRARSSEVLQVIAEHAPDTVWEVARHLSWSRGWKSLTALPLRLAVSETAAHIEHLKLAGHHLGIPTRLDRRG
ncbi:MBL fold metallo-hydrolase [Paeniglutamicibacter sp. MACA_103]|uniref:MBL fold metallo-hydrolase n=1 Tax=Paeniglutamicibacter sp. MACA_103 TaxID=3377337 RepID=UPI003892FE82